MYEFPYGAGQQLNLNWIINEIITLHKQLDPDYELPNFDNAFPFMNLNQLNLDWILRELKAIKDLAPTEDAQLLKMVANALIANTYDATTQYNVDDIVYRDSDNRLYKCITATPAGGEPFDSSKWVEVDVGEVLTDLLNSVEPYNGTPTMNGTASAGTSTQYARGDHIHPKDTTRVPTSRTVNGKALSSNITLNASDIPNDSNVSGENTDDALNSLLNHNSRGVVDTQLLTDSWLVNANSGEYQVQGTIKTGTFIEDASTTYGTLSVVFSSDNNYSYGFIIFHATNGDLYYRDFTRNVSSANITWRTPLNLLFRTNSDIDTWTPLTYTENFHNYNDATANQLKYKKVGGVVTIIGVFSPTTNLTATANGYLVAENLPQECRPPSTYRSICQGSGMNRFLFNVNANGTLGVARYGITTDSDMTTSTWLPVSVTYLV